MSNEWGIALDLARAARDPEGFATLARQAEQGDLDLVVLRSSDDGDEDVAGLDPWTAAAWLAGRTSRIPIAAGDFPAGVLPSMAEKVRESLGVLAGTRVVEAADVALADLATAVAEVAAQQRGPRPRRSAAVRAQRRAGIDYDGIPGSLAEEAVEPGDPLFRRFRNTYMRGGSPGLILRARTAAEVADALAFASRHRDLPFGVRSGGHGVSGRSTNRGGLVLDVGAMNDVDVLDETERLVRIGPGATWKQVAAVLDKHDWALGSGDYGGVGVGGLATAGGIGLLGRAHGLTIDHLRAVELVTADGTPVRASATENADLFWAVRGAGANFGVATAFEFEVSEVREVGWAQLVLVAPDIEEALRLFGEAARSAPRDTTVFLVTGPPRQGQSVIQLYGMVDSPDPEVVVERLTPFARIGLLAQQRVVLTRYADVMGEAADVGPDGHHGGGEPVSRSAFLPVLTDEFAAAAARLLNSGQVYFFQLRHMGGAIADVPAGATAFAHRTPEFQVAALGGNRRGLDTEWDRLAGHFDGLYLSFDTDLRPERLRDAFPPPVLARLRELKRRYDPTNLFRDNFNIDPGDNS